MEKWMFDVIKKENEANPALTGKRMAVLKELVRRNAEAAKNMLQNPAIESLFEKIQNASSDYTRFDDVKDAIEDAAAALPELEALEAALRDMASHIRMNSLMEEESFQYDQEPVPYETAMIIALQRTEETARRFAQETLKYSIPCLHQFIHDAKSVGEQQASGADWAAYQNPLMDLFRLTDRAAIMWKHMKENLNEVSHTSNVKKEYYAIQEAYSRVLYPYDLI